MSHFIIDLYVAAWMPSISRPMNDGTNRASGHLNLSLPINTFEFLYKTFFYDFRLNSAGFEMGKEGAYDIFLEFLFLLSKSKSFDSQSIGTILIKL